ncbi:MAG: HAD superfamily hydrolase (TIGR01490 family) [Planctomycetota bacterium]|jgi:HAD superfamily hydrolase (TIGR01490 family)
MTLAIFDLDNTLLAGDSDYLWGEYMVEQRIVDETSYRERNAAFFQDYERGELDNDRYLEFSLEPLTQYSLEQLYHWRQDYVDNWITPIVAPGARALLDKHREMDHTLMIISATNLFITQPIAAMLEVPILLSTEPEIIDNRYTGRYLGTATYQQGKVIVLNDWLKTHNLNLDGSYFYSDSINDLPLLEQVDKPIVVNPDAPLRSTAEARDWEIIDLR